LSSSDLHDVIVIGGGPAGSVMAWSLAKRGVRVAIVERATFPREKVCGDFIEPAGLRILDAMGCRTAVQASCPLPITATRVYFGPRLGYRGAIPYYDAQNGLPPYGYVVPRRILDHHLLEHARAVSATVYEGCQAARIRREDGRIYVEVRTGKTNFTLSSLTCAGSSGPSGRFRRRSARARAAQAARQRGQGTGCSACSPTSPLASSA